MRKIAVSLAFLCAGLFFNAHLVKAEVPSGAFFFGDGKGYDISGNQTYFCFGDGSCYTVQGVFAFSRNPVQPVTIINNYYTSTSTPSPVAPVPALKLAYKSWSELLSATGISYVVNQDAKGVSVDITGISNPFAYSLTYGGQSIRGTKLETFTGQIDDIVFTYPETGREDTVLHITVVGQ